LETYSSTFVSSSISKSKPRGEPSFFGSSNIKNEANLGQQRRAEGYRKMHQCSHNFVIQFKYKMCKMGKTQALECGSSVLPRNKYHLI